jgi:hypothetical protein
MATITPKTSDKSLNQLKEEICDIGRRIYNKGFAAGNDGNIDGDYNHLGRPIYHSAATGIGQFYEIDLANGSPTDHAVDILRFFNRTDFTSNNSLRFSLRNAAGTTVWAENISVSRDTIVRGGRPSRREC